MNNFTLPYQAHSYDAGVRQVIPFYDAIQAETLELVRAVVGEPKLWLDTGAGTGALVERAMPQFPGTRFILADPMEAMLVQARSRFAAVSSDRVKILSAVASEGLPKVEPSLQVQVVTAIMCHHYLEPQARRAAVQGCYDILAPGGVLVVFENVDCETPRGRAFGLARWGDYQLQHGRTPEEVEKHLARFGTELKPVRISEHLDLFRSVGFSSTEVLWRAHMQAGFYAVK